MEGLKVRLALLMLLGLSGAALSWDSGERCAPIVAASQDGSDAIKHPPDRIHQAPDGLLSAAPKLSSEG